MRYNREDGCRAWLTYGQIQPDVLAALMDEYGSGEAIYDRFLHDDDFLHGRLKPQQLSLLRTQAQPDSMHDMMLVMRRHDMGIIALTDDTYPDALRNIPDPPALMFYRGSLDCLMGRCIAMVGSRKALPQTVAVTEQIARELSLNGVTVISGLAMGIDAAAHRGCMEGTSPTAAVLGCGIDQEYPIENAALKEKIVENGGVLLSEYPPGTPPIGWHFPVRNRILSGLCKGVIMMEARIRSGSMTTVQHALDQGREVFAYPGSIGSEWAEGAHQLLREGASYFTSAADVLEDLDWLDGAPAVPTPQQKSDLPPLSPDQRKVYQQLAQGEMSFDQLAQATGMDTPELSGALTMLQIFGLIRSLPGKIYGKV